MKRFSLFILLGILLICQNMFAQVNFTVQPPTRVFEGDRFPITFKLTNAEGSDLNVSQINGCTLLYGPSTSQRQSYQVVNGRATSSSSVEYTYYYKAGKAGQYTIPAASVIADGKRYTTKPVNFTIHESADRNTPASQRPVDVDDVDTQAAGRRVNRTMSLSVSFYQNPRLMNRKR